MNTKLLCFSLLVSLTLCGCSGMEKSAGQVLENGGSVIRHESAKVWMSNETPEEPQEEEEARTKGASHQN